MPVLAGRLVNNSLQIISLQRSIQWYLSTLYLVQSLLFECLVDQVHQTVEDPFYFDHVARHPETGNFILNSKAIFLLNSG